MQEGARTPGIVRDLAFELPGVTQMRARAEPHASSDWHHHGDRDVVGYVVRGRARLEFGPGGADATEIGPGGFFHVPARLVHRDVNPGDELQELVIAIVGDGPLVVNVDGPNAA
jgi:uncharacterized RmlC-like cupin family protein